MTLTITLAFLSGRGAGEIGIYQEDAPAVSPTAIASQPDDIEEAELVVANGALAIEELRLLEDAPTVLHVTNRDEWAYRFRIVEELVRMFPIAANAVTAIEFTTPNADVYQGQLLPAGGDEPLDEMRVVVRSAGSVDP